TTASGKDAKRLWVLDADLKAAFDRIDHNQLLKQIGSFPARGMIREWLKAGVVEKGLFTPTERGTPQGGVISPVLMNVALHGMETAIKEGYAKRNAVEKPLMVRYADDFVIFHSNLEELHRAVGRVTQWLAEMGLHLSPKKTRITHTLTPFQGQVGFDFLGFTIRQFPVGKTHTGKSRHG